ncbi:serine peptidase, partial [Rugamonas sp. FT107W]|nr:serine peptidase [Duganella vulcania]
MSPAAFGLAPATAAAPVTGAVIGLPDFADLVDRVGPAVVNIRTTERLKLGGRGGADGQPGEEEMQEFL